MPQKQPSIAAICLYADRPQFIASMLESFRQQTYENKWLVIFDNGIEPFEAELQPRETLIRDPAQGRTIGELRNAAITLCNSDIIAHSDSDDWSGAHRLAEQVALLQSSSADVVGYNEMLFWREAVSDEDCECGWYPDGKNPECKARPGEAWLYTSPVPKPTLGTSLAYWRRVWERKSFNPRLPNNSEATGEDWDFIQGLKCAAVSSLFAPGKDPTFQDPRMIARIHGGNTTKYNIEDSRGSSWKRVPEWDARIKEILG